MHTATPTSVAQQPHKLPPPAPGIYELAGTMDGDECWIAYDRDGECKVEHGVGAYHALETWLRTRGVVIAASAPLLSLLR